MEKFDVIIAGASFAGLACAKALARHGVRVAVLERKIRPGRSVHTTGILVKEASETLDLPEKLVHKITKIHLFSPSLKPISLHAPDYYFLTTDTPLLMEQLSADAKKAGGRLFYGTPFKSATQTDQGIRLKNPDLRARYLIGADGPRSRVARVFGLGTNTKTLVGVEAEFKNTPLPDPKAFYCFLDQTLAKGYLGWVIPGVGITQVGLASAGHEKPDLDGFIEKVSPLIPLDKKNIAGRRGGLIPVGGPVSPLWRGNVLLLGDAAGTVSPLTGGGIHTALYFGHMAGDLIGKNINQNNPLQRVADAYPRFYGKRLLRFGFEHMAPNFLLDAVIGSHVFKSFSKSVFFRKKRL